ncbi:DUF1697 domain-containing protein [Mycobacterium sp. MBM]|nr:DUF1697 domain-containing protein [Mycobacterium sp. MBM]
MTRYVAFLRGVNVGGVTLKMAEVAAVFTGAGFTAVKTVLASGNVLLDSPSTAASVRATAEATLRENFGYDAWVLVYPLGTVREISTNYPFERDVPDHHCYVTFVSEADALQELVTLAEDAGETAARGNGVLYWQVARSATLSSAIGKTMGKRRYKSCTTTRNLRTLDKVLA